MEEKHSSGMAGQIQGGKTLSITEKSAVLQEILTFSSLLDDDSNIDDFTFEYIVKHPKEFMIILDGYDEYSQQDYIAGNLEEHPIDARHKMPVAVLCSKLIKGKILKGAHVLITSRPDESDKLGGIRFKRLCEALQHPSCELTTLELEIHRSTDTGVTSLCKALQHPNFKLTTLKLKDDLITDAGVASLCKALQHPNCKLTTLKLKGDLITDTGVASLCETLPYPSSAKLLLERKPTFDESEIEGGFELEEVNKLKGSGLLYCGQPYRTGLITTTKHFSFTHLTVQEFLAAHWFVKENCIPVEKCSEMVFQFIAGILSSEGKEELMEKLLTSGQLSGSIREFLRAKCLSEYQDKEFAKTFIRNYPQAFSSLDGVVSFSSLSDIDCIALSFVLDIISELTKEKAVEAQHKCSDKFVPVEELRLVDSHLTMSGIQRVCNSLINEHSLVSELFIGGPVTDTGVASLCEALQHPSCKLTTLKLNRNKITDTGVASLREALQHLSCKLTKLKLNRNKITDTGVASLCEALQHPSCKLTTLILMGNEITDVGVASLCEALQHPSCELTTLNLMGNEITDAGVASLCEASQHPSCKLTALKLNRNKITDTGVASLCEALQHPSCKLTRL
ncbi:NACHT, LRR and PYD domains-containing protein 12, partial [Stylophora pistillata]